MFIKKPPSASIFAQDASAPTIETVPEPDTRTDLFGRLLRVRGLCEDVERNIRRFETTAAAGGGPDPAVQSVPLIGNFAVRAKELVDAMPPGADRNVVARTAQREGMALADQAKDASLNATRHFEVNQIKRVLDAQEARVRLSPKNLRVARDAVGELINAATGFDAADKRLIAVNASQHLDRAVESRTRRTSPGNAESSVDPAFEGESNAPQGLGDSVSTNAAAAGVVSAAAPSDIFTLFEVADSPGLTSFIKRQVAGRALGVALGAVGAFLASTRPLNGLVVDREFQTEDGTRIHVRFVESQPIGRVTTTDPNGGGVEFEIEHGLPDNGLVLHSATHFDGKGGHRVLSGEELSSAVASVSDQLRQQGVDLRLGVPADTGFPQDPGIDTTILPARKGKNKQKGRPKTQRGKRRLKGDDPLSGLETEELRAIQKRGSGGTSAEQQRAKQVLKDRGDANKQKRRGKKRRKRR